jgi:hypothetical protein
MPSEKCRNLESPRSSRLRKQGVPTFFPTLRRGPAGALAAKWFIYVEHREGIEPANTGFAGAVYFQGLKKTDRY